MPSNDHFDFIAPYYDRFAGKRNPEALIALANLPVKGPILDIGGGTGRVSQALVGMGSQVIIVDPSEGMLAQAATKNGLDTICAFSSKLPFPPRMFDTIIMVDAFHHVGDQKETASELWRVLMPGGRLVIEEPDIRKLSVKFVALVERIALMRSHFMSPLDIAAYFQGCDATACR